MKTEKPKADAVRLRELDALRGLASFTVILCHFSGAYLDAGVILHGPKLGILKFYLIHAFTAGGEAVLLFFLLSGFVLSLPAISKSAQSYPVFITRRIFRIYFPYLVALALAVLGNFFWHGPLGMTPWAGQTWHYPVQWGAVWQHVLFIGTYDTAQFNTAFWSLVIEMRISIFFPLLCFLVLRIRPWMSISAVILVSILETYVAFGEEGPEAIKTLYYAGMFVIGILLALYKDPLIRWASSLSKASGAGCLAAALLLYLYGATGMQIVSKIWMPHAYKLPVFDLATVLGACMVIVLGLGFPPVNRFLLSKIPQFLGRISYSMYLVHSTILFTLLFLIGRRIPAFAILLIYVSLVVVASEVVYRLVERPSMDGGRWVSRRLKPWAGILGERLEGC